MSCGRTLNVVVVGDGNAGKNCIFTKFKENFEGGPVEYVPTIFDNFSRAVEVDGLYYHISLSYTTGQAEYDRLRMLSYPNTDVFLVCYAVSSRTSFESLFSKWIPELQFNCPSTPIVIVGTKIDMRKGESASADYVSYAEGKTMSRWAGTFIECSAKTGENLQEVFREAVRAVQYKSRSRENMLKLEFCGCILM